MGRSMQRLGLRGRLDAEHGGQALAAVQVEEERLGPPSQALVADWR